MVYTGLLLRLLAEYTANQKCSAVLLCSADSIYGYPMHPPPPTVADPEVLAIGRELLISGSVANEGDLGRV